VVKRTPTLGKHIERTPHGFRASLRIAGVLHQQRFPQDTPLYEIKKWLLTTEMRYRRQPGRKTGRFEDDARAYLETVRAMPTFEQRRQHIDEWIAVFGARRRDSITGDDIAAQLHAWRSMPRTITKRGGKQVEITLSAAAVNKRRTALMHMYSVLDGKAERNPVRDAPKFAEPAPAPRGLAFETLARIFRQMPASKSKARLMVIAYTGIPPAQLRTIQPSDVDLVRGTVAVEGRRKGKGTAGRIVPLIPQAITAFRLMAREDAWGPFTLPPLARALDRARKAAKVKAHIRPYDLRHSFGTEVYRRTGDIRATQILLDHSTERLSHRYTVAAQESRVQAAIDAFQPAKVDRRVATRRKTRGRRRR